MVNDGACSGAGALFRVLLPALFVRDMSMMGYPISSYNRTLPLIVVVANLYDSGAKAVVTVAY